MKDQERGGEPEEDCEHEQHPGPDPLDVTIGDVVGPDSSAPPASGRDKDRDSTAGAGEGTSGAPAR